MANNCDYVLQVTALNKEAIERFYKIMKYEDNEYFLYRVFAANPSCDDGWVEKADDFYTAEFWGDVAWSPSPWVNDEPNPNEYIKTGAHYSNLQEICKALNIAVEVWAKECGNCFQEHITVNNHGELIDHETVEWEDEWGDEETGEWHEETGGFDEYGDFYLPTEVFEKSY